MPIVEVSTFKEFIDETEDKTDPKRFLLIYTESHRTLVMRPKVSTPRLDTVVLRNLSDNDLIEAQDKFRGIMIIFRCQSLKISLGLVIVKNREQFREFVLEVQKDENWRERYKFSYADENLFLRPIVSTPRLLTVLLPGITKEQLEEIKKEKFMAGIKITEYKHLLVSEEQELPAPTAPKRK